MVSKPIRQALILAHQTLASGQPAALVRTGGVPQLKRLLLTLRRSGVRRFVVVAGPHGPRLRALVSRHRQLAELELVWVSAPNAQTDGEATLAAAAHLRGDFFLCQCDHVFAPALLSALSAEPLDGITLAAARSWMPSQGDGLGLRLRAGARVREVGAAAGQRDAVWTGVATCDATLFDVLAELRDTKSTVDLEHAFAYLTAVGCARIADADGALWHHIRTRDGLRKANKLLLGSLRKPEVDGIIARTINRHFSLFLTRLLMNLPVRPNHVTFVTLLVALGAGVVSGLATAESAWRLGAGAALWQLASMLDGTDGELARLKFQGSKFGEWFDTVVDDAGRLFVFLGMGIGLSNVTGHSLWAQMMTLTVILQTILNIKIYRQLAEIGAGSHFALAWTKDRAKERNETLWSRFWTKIEFMCRRDYYIFMFMVFGVTGFSGTAAVLAFTTTVIVVGHELAWPRRARDRQVANSVLVRDQQRA
ncbi:MAG: hypothetical protein GY946_30095 [bacterium]|nr:hypothetical protein [bacterium]